MHCKRMCLVPWNSHEGRSISQRGKRRRIFRRGLASNSHEQSLYRGRQDLA